LPLLGSVGDDGVLYANGTEAGPLIDRVVPGTIGLGVRSYEVDVRVLSPDPGSTVALDTSPVADWASPSQAQGGPDALPPISEWSWIVERGGRNDSSNWTMNNATGLLERNLPWQNATFEVVGVFEARESVDVWPANVTGPSPTELGYSLNGWSPGARTGYASPVTPAAAALHAGIVRFGLSSTGTILGWNVSAGAPVMNFSRLDAILGFIESLGAAPMLSLPAGSWGNGNTLPPGMPLNGSMAVPFNGSVGYFPDPTAFASLVRTIANHAAAYDEPIPYWEVGNEVPLVNASEVATFAALISVGATAIHRSLPTALVSADDMTNKHYIDQFAAATSGVGFLSFHYYPANTICLSNDSYCPPGTFGLGTPDSAFWSPGANLSGTAMFLAPPLAQAEWRSDTGTELPILDTESNLNAVGGAVTGATVGTDPRLQTLFGAAWLGSTLIDASRANVSSLTYFRITNPVLPNATASGPFGGFGFGMTAINLSGSFVEFAPYWASYLWANSVPSNGRAVAVSCAGASDVVAYAVRSESNVTIVLVNRMATTINTTIEFPDARSWHPSNLTVLDARTYQEVYNASSNTVSIDRSGIASLPPPADGGPVELEGYGMAVLTGAYGVVNATGSSNGSLGSNGSVGSNASGPSDFPSGAAPPADSLPPRSPGRSAPILLDTSPTGARPTMLGVDANGWAGLGLTAAGGLVAIAAWRSSAPLPPRRRR